MTHQDAQSQNQKHRKPEVLSYKSVERRKRPQGIPVDYIHLLPPRERLYSRPQHRILKICIILLAVSLIVVTTSLTITTIIAIGNLTP